MTVTPTPVSLLDQPTMVQNMAAAVQANAPAPFPMTAGCVVLAIIQAVASVGLWFQWLVLLCLGRSRLATSSGNDCDTFGADFNFTRLPAVAATGYVTFTTTGAAFIPVGAQVKSADGTQIFTILADPTNTFWNGSTGFQLLSTTTSANFLVQAATAGIGGNVGANTITLLGTSIPFVSLVTNAAAFTNGVAAETDAAFRIRFVEYIAGLPSACEAAVVSAIVGVQQGLSYTIQENTNTGGSYQPGFFTVTIDDGSGAAHSSVLTAVTNAINLVRPIGSSFAVQRPTLITATVGLTITVAAGYTKSTMLAPVAAAINAFINSLSVGAALPYSRIAQCAYDAVPGIVNVTSVLVNSGTSDVGGGATQVVRSGVVTVS